MFLLIFYFTEHIQCIITEDGDTAVCFRNGVQLSFMLFFFVVDISTAAALRTVSQYQPAICIITERIGAAVCLFDAGAVAAFIIGITGYIGFFIDLAVHFEMVSIFCKTGITQRVFDLCDHMIWRIIVGSGLTEAVGHQVISFPGMVFDPSFQDAAVSPGMDTAAIVIIFPVECLAVTVSFGHHPVLMVLYAGQLS